MRSGAGVLVWRSGSPPRSHWTVARPCMFYFVRTSSLMVLFPVKLLLLLLPLGDKRDSRDHIGLITEI